VPRLRAGAVVEFAFQLRLAQQQHPAQLVYRDPAEKLLDLPERQAQVLECDDAVELPQLPGRVGAVAGDRINLGGRQQADLVVVPQGADGYRAKPGELPDAEHDTSMPPSPNVRVNPGCGGYEIRAGKQPYGQPGEASLLQSVAGGLEGGAHTPADLRC